jgi:HD-GYP domain-containing protein (c-di-GMP phosphodiesterase class II)
MTGYRTRSMLVLPMRNRDGETLGILQLINRKRSARIRLESAEAVSAAVIPFDSACEELLLSLASQAAVALENNLLYKSIQGLFEGFVNASVTAIESRDPTTSGHSSRVADLTVGLASLVDGLGSGPFADVRFTPDQLREIRYASLLHDFGKVGVREEVLIKAKKLYPHTLELLKSRFAFIQVSIENRHLRKQLDHVLTHGVAHFHSCRHAMDEACSRETDLLGVALATILQANEPTVLEEGRFHEILEIATRTYLDASGDERPWLSPQEVAQLSIRRGTLDALERREIESHVTHTFRFLKQIPWTRDLAGVPLIAESHHEKLNGSGYPHGLLGDAIPIQSRMMAIADIFDALTASDRPYKKAVPLERALDILGHEARDGHIDRRLLDLFIEGRIFERVLRQKAAIS